MIKRKTPRVPFRNKQGHLAVVVVGYRRVLMNRNEGARPGGYILMM